MKPSIKTLRDLAACAGVNAKGMNALQIREAYNKMQSDIEKQFGFKLCDQHTCTLEEYLTMAGV